MTTAEAIHQRKIVRMVAENAIDLSNSKFHVELMGLRKLVWGWLQDESNSLRKAAYGDCYSEINELVKRYAPEDGG